MMCFMDLEHLPNDGTVHMPTANPILKRGVQQITTKRPAEASVEDEPVKKPKIKEDDMGAKSEAEEPCSSTTEVEELQNLLAEKEEQNRKLRVEVRDLKEELEEKEEEIEDLQAAQEELKARNGGGKSGRQAPRGRASKGSRTTRLVQDQEDPFEALKEAHETELAAKDQLHKVQLQVKDTAHQSALGELKRKHVKLQEEKQKACEDKLDKWKQIYLEKLDEHREAMKMAKAECEERIKHLKSNQKAEREKLKEEQKAEIEKLKADQRTALEKYKPEHSILLKERDSMVKKQQSEIQKLQTQAHKATKRVSELDSTVEELTSAKQDVENISDKRRVIISNLESQIKYLGEEKDALLRMQAEHVLELEKQLRHENERWKLAYNKGEDFARKLIAEHRSNFVLRDMVANRDGRLTTAKQEIEDLKAQLTDARAKEGRLSLTGGQEQHVADSVNQDGPESSRRAATSESAHHIKHAVPQPNQNSMRAESDEPDSEALKAEGNVAMINGV